MQNPSLGNVVVRRDSSAGAKGGAAVARVGKTVALVLED